MIDRPVIIVDLDHVLYSWLDDMRQALNEYFGVPLEQTAVDPNSWDLDAWNVPKGMINRAWRRMIEYGDMYNNQAPLGGAVAIQALWTISDLEYHIHIVTARLNQFGLHHHVTTSTVNWLAAYNIPYRSLSFTKNKNMPALVMIDDSPRHLDESAAEHKLLWDAGHNQDDIGSVRVFSWSDVLHHLEWKVV